VSYYSITISERKKFVCHNAFLDNNNCSLRKTGEGDATTTKVIERGRIVLAASLKKLHPRVPMLYNPYPNVPRMNNKKGRNEKGGKEASIMASSSRLTLLFFDVSEPHSLALRP
jgi:hypothetical protein